MKLNEVTYQMYQDAIDAKIAVALGVENANGSHKNYLGARMSAIKKFYEDLTPEQKKEVEREAALREQYGLNVETKRKCVHSVVWKTRATYVI